MAPRLKLIKVRRTALAAVGEAPYPMDLALTLFEAVRNGDSICNAQEMGMRIRLRWLNLDLHLFKHYFKKFTCIPH